MLTIHLLYIAFIMFRYDPYVFNSFRTLSWRAVEFCLLLLRWSCDFCPWFYLCAVLCVLICICWSWCITILVHDWIWFTRISLRIFASNSFIREIGPCFVLYFCYFNYNVSWRGSFQVMCIWSSKCLLYLASHFSPKFGEFSAIISLNKFSVPFFCISVHSFWHRFVSLVSSLCHIIP
jgi:hypothetical protein